MEGASSAAIEVLVQNLINVVKEEYSLIRGRGIDKEAKQLQTTLGMTQSYLNDAENKSITLDAVKLWLRDLEASAFDADNVLDEISYHLLRNKVEKVTMEPENTNKVLSYFSSVNQIVRKRDMALKIKQVNADFDLKNKTATDLNLQSVLMNAPPTYALHDSIATSSVAVDQFFIGRDDVVSEIVDQLSEISGEEKISILTIVGMGGMGKTTLTRKVFHHEKIKARFGSRIWVHVSQIFDPIDLFKKILSTLTSQTSDGVENKEIILKKLQEALKSKTYLLVLDDIWNEDLSKWEDFINSMLGATSTMGNGIIMSTRKENVASLVSPLHTHHLKGLSVEECWSIIKAKVFEHRQVPSSGFEVIGRNIAERCGGLPLAANVVGGVLRCKSEQEWHRFINENWISDDGGKNISKILKLRFDYLPSPSLKKCFAYCSIFPKGCNINKQELIEQWMAEGFLLQADGKKEEIESVGEKFINLLLHNSLLQVSYKDKYGNLGTYCVMHDLVHDLARSCFNQDRYIYMIYDDPNPIAKKSAKCVRTLLLRSDELSDTMFSDFESLRVLVLVNSKGANKLPNSIRKLIHLRLLDISQTRIQELPEWIGELHHLQTLRAARFLRKLPGTLKYLINLRHLYIPSEVELPANTGRLTCLQTLPHFNVGDNKGGYGIEQLGSLKNLKGRLVICNLERVHDKEEALKANISHKPNLLELGFKWDEAREAGETNDESVLEGLQPHPFLKKIEINGYKGRRFPSWTQKMEVRDGPQQGSSWVPLNNLVEIKLLDCWECEETPMLGHLLNLKSLYLRGLKNVRIINSSFNKLTKLRLERLERLECLPDWLFYNNPNLEDLWIEECPKLRELPDGLHTLTSLEWLDIRNCPNLKSITGNNNIPGGGSGGGGGLLHRLSIEDCGNLVELPRQMVEYWAPSLVYLGLKELRSLQNLPMVIDCLAKSAARLEELVIVGVPKFMGSSSSNSVESWPCGSLREIEIDVSMEWTRESSGSIKETVEAMLLGCRNSLTLLKLKGRIDWDWLPASIQYLVSLEDLLLESFGIKELPQWLGNLSSLRQLNLHSCNKLRHLPPGDAYKALTKLEILDIRDCPELEVDSEWRNIPRLSLTIEVDDHSSESGLNLASFGRLKLKGRIDWDWLLAPIPYFVSLKELTLENIGVEELPQCLGNLSSLCISNLQYVQIRDFPKLRHIDSEWCKIPYHESAYAWVKGPPPASSLPAVETQKENVAATEKKPGTETLTKDSSSNLHEVIPTISAADSNSSSISERKIEQQFAVEIADPSILESKMSVSALDSQQRVESESHGEIQPAEITTVRDPEMNSVKLQERVVSSTAERSDIETVRFKDEQLYSVVEKNNHLQLILDDQVISIGDYPSPSTSGVNAMLNLVGQDLQELSEESNYTNSLMILLLQRNKRLAHIHPSSFNAVSELRFLDISDTKIRILPSSLFKLSKLKVLLLRNCLCLETLPPEIGNLIHLELLDLSGSELYELPDEIGQLEHVRNMQLSFYGPDDENEYEHLPSRLVSPTFLSKLDEMEALSIIVHPEDHRWTETAACIIQDMSKLEKLSYLQFYFPVVEMFENFIEMSPSWKEKSLVKFDFTLGQDVKRISSRVPDEVELLFSQHERCLRYVDGDMASPLLKSVLTRVTSFYLDHHTQVQSLSEFDISNFNELKFCVVRECPKIHAIVDEKSAIVAFARLEYLGIFLLWELEHIWMPVSRGWRMKRIFKTPTPLTNKSFEALRHLIIKRCPKLQFILWESMLLCLANLEELVVEDCEKVKKIIKGENYKVKYKKQCPFQIKETCTTRSARVGYSWKRCSSLKRRNQFSWLSQVDSQVSGF